MKKLSTAIAAILLLTSCTPAADPNFQTIPTTKPIVITSFYPLYELAYQIGGTHIQLQNLVPAGTEPHDYEPTLRKIADINKANLLIYNGAGLEPWTEKLSQDLQKSGVKTLKISDLFKNQTDPHFWLNPQNYIKEAQTIRDKLIEIDPNSKADYEDNSQNFITQLQNLDQQYKNILKNCKLKDFVTNHAAFAYLAQQYELNMIAISGISPDEEPSPKDLADLSSLIKEKNIKYILTESLLSPKIAEILASENGAKTLVLNPLEGLTDEELSQGKNYITVMLDNLKNLQTALECNP